jgi:UDP-N-acetylglucosamine:LPS N-acetylglucosamine transferase
MIFPGINAYHFGAARTLRKERPGLILSTGAGPAVPFALAGNILGVPSLYIETFARVSKPSLTGRIMYYLAARFFYQWKLLVRYYPKASYGGLLL